MIVRQHPPIGLWQHFRRDVFGICEQRLAFRKEIQ